MLLLTTEVSQNFNQIHHGSRVVLIFPVKFSRSQFHCHKKKNKRPGLLEVLKIEVSPSPMSRIYLIPGLKNSKLDNTQTGQHSPFPAFEYFMFDIEYIYFRI